MEMIFAFILIIMLITVGYAKVQQGVVKTIGHISYEVDEE